MRRSLASLLVAALVAALGAALVILTPAAATAARSSAMKDPRGDVINGDGIDMKRVTLKKKGKRIVVTFTAWDGFADADLARPGGLGVDFRLTAKVVRGAKVSHDGQGVYGEICSYRERRSGVPQRSKCSSVPVKRLSGTTYRLTVPLAKIDKGAQRLRWMASAMVNNGAAGCTSGFCLDPVGRGTKTWRL